MLQILKEELENGMQLCGVTRLDEVGSGEQARGGVDALSTCSIERSHTSKQ